MKIEAALQAVQCLYVDTVPLIYYVEEHPVSIAKMDRIIDFIEAKSIADSAAALRARYNLRTPDVLHVATAIQTRGDAMLTNDAGIQPVQERTILLLDELEL